MRAWIVDNGLLDHTGHHFNNSAGLREGCVRRGMQTRALVHRHALPAVVRALDAQPAFDYGPYDFVSDDPLAGPLENLIILGRAFAEGLLTAGTEFGPADLVLVPSTMQNEVYGCALGFTQLPPERRPRLVLNFVIENFFERGTRNPGPIAPLYRFAARQLSRVIPPERLLLTAGGGELTESLEHVLALPVAEFPMPKVYRSESPPPTSARGRPCVAIIGHSRAEKGFHLVPELVARHPGLRFLIQVAPAGSESLWGDAGAGMNAAPNAELVRGTLDPHAYHALMARADVMLMPYNRALMPLRSSGVFSEAVAAGKVTVVPAGTWMAGHLAEGRGAGVTFDHFDVDAISAALEAAVTRLPELQTRARASAPAWRAQQSSDAYLDRVLQTFGLRGRQD